MYSPLFLPLRAETGEIYLSEYKISFSASNKLSAFESEINLLHKAVLRARGISLLHMAHRPKGRASEIGLGSCRGKADSRNHERNPLAETADRQSKTAAMVLPTHGGVHNHLLTAIVILIS